MSPSLGRYPTRRPRGRIRKVGRRQRPICARAICAGGLDPLCSYLRLQQTPAADPSLQLGSTGIDRVFPTCADGFRKYLPKCATVHGGSLQALVARPEAHGVIWAYLGAEVSGAARSPSFAVVVACQRSLWPWLAASRTAREPRSGSLDWRRSYLRSQKLIHSIGGPRWRGQ